jgi:hypothetical protein
MIWAGFVGNKLGPIVYINGTVNSDVYIDIVRQDLLPYLDALTEDGTTDIVFQQDNAPAHTSKKTHDFLHTAILEHRFKIIEWPLNSPDMNLIKHL